MVPLPQVERGDVDVALPHAYGDVVEGGYRRDWVRPQPVARDESHRSPRMRWCRRAIRQQPAHLGCDVVLRLDAVLAAQDAQHSDVKALRVCRIDGVGLGFFDGLLDLRAEV